ncbi:hypothetical protein PENPOL_c016G07833 [Penicillium polonicum]|uniref:Major facilitator superfamily (MFS) profile domain-containing protein n=1 Tax=Penicillium polonicum TaxID=60169 RepID=A0A1V6NAM8_PENPO|nr:hypothetical protein PENPOL_c016G07833 [Penicillium polonicum]
MSTLMQAISFGDKDAVFMSLTSLLTAVIVVIGAILAVLYMERFGRWYWANAMLPGFFIRLVLVGTRYTIDADRYRGGTGGILYMGFFGSYA